MVTEILFTLSQTSELRYVRLKVQMTSVVDQDPHSWLEFVKYSAQTFMFNSFKPIDYLRV